MTDWDAQTYHRLSEPQLAWGRRVAEKLAPHAGERILDIGSGTGRLTTELAASVPGVSVVGLDISQAMLTEARRDAKEAPVWYVRGSAVSLPFPPSTFDAVFSGATFHWVLDHSVLFEQIHCALKPGGRLVAQCGGGPNLQRLLDRTHALMDSAAYASYFDGWCDPWYFAGVADTRERLIAAGFRDADVSLEPAPTTLPDSRAFGEFISCVCVRHHVDRLPAGERPRFIAQLASAAAQDDPPFTLDYWRLNISAVKAGDE